MQNETINNKETIIKNEKKVLENKGPEIFKKESNFIKLRDLTNEDVKNFKRALVTFYKTERKKGPGYNVSINIDLQFETHFKNIKLAPGGKYLTEDRFDLIAAAIELDPFDENGRVKTEWIRKVPVRFVKGEFNDGGDYYALEIIFKQYFYDTHFFDSDQRRLIEIIDGSSVNIEWANNDSKINKIKDADFALEVEF